MNNKLKKEIYMDPVEPYNPLPMKKKSFPTKNLILQKKY